MTVLNLNFITHFLLFFLKRTLIIQNLKYFQNLIYFQNYISVSKMNCSQSYNLRNIWYSFVMMMAMFWWRHWSLKWREIGSENDRGRHGDCKWRRRVRVMVWRRRIQRIEQDGEWEWERFLAEWGKSGHPRLRG